MPGPTRECQTHIRVIRPVKAGSASGSYFHPIATISGTREAQLRAARKEVHPLMSALELEIERRLQAPSDRASAWEYYIEFVCVPATCHRIRCPLVFCQLCMPACHLHSRPLVQCHWRALTEGPTSWRPFSFSPSHVCCYRVACAAFLTTLPSSACPGLRPTLTRRPSQESRRCAAR